MMHETFFNRLNEHATVKLVSKLKDPRIGYDIDNEFSIFIPDLHLFTSYRQRQYRYVTHTNYNENSRDLLPTILRTVRQFKLDSAEEGKKVHIFQLGDFIDLWRETPKPFNLNIKESQQVIQRIAEDNSFVWDQLMDNETNTQFVLGNHDFDLFRAPTISAKFRYLKQYITNADGLPAVAVLHGDIFDWIEQLPEWLRRTLVYYLSPHQKVSPEPPEEEPMSPKDFLKEYEKGLRQTHKQGNKYNDYPNLPPSPPVSAGCVSRDEAPESQRWNLEGPDKQKKTEPKFLSKAGRFFQDVKKEKGHDIKMVVLGHTHHPRIALEEKNGSFFALMDCGSWVEDFTGTVRENGTEIQIKEKNAQIGVLGQQEARIYQLSPL